MLSRTMSRIPEINREKLLWAIASAMVVGQLGAFWALCYHQVSEAEMREATTQLERMAVADCLRLIPGATLSSCAATVSTQDRGASSAATNQIVPVNTAAPDAPNGAVPVNYVYR